MSSIQSGTDANIISDANIILTNHTIFCWLVTFFTAGRGWHFDLSPL